MESFVSFNLEVFPNDIHILDNIFVLKKLEQLIQVDTVIALGYVHCRAVQFGPPSSHSLLLELLKLIKDLVVLEHAITVMVEQEGFNSSQHHLSISQIMLRP